MLTDVSPMIIVLKLFILIVSNVTPIQSSPLSTLNCNKITDCLTCNLIAYNQLCFWFDGQCEVNDGKVLEDDQCLKLVKIKLSYVILNPDLPKQINQMPTWAHTLLLKAFHNQLVIPFKFNNWTLRNFASKITMRTPVNSTSIDDLEFTLDPHIHVTSQCSFLATTPTEASLG